MKIIAHIFPGYKQAYAHLKDIWDKQEVLEVNKTRPSYRMRDGTKHLCFVVRNREEVGDFLAYALSDFKVHEGHYSGMSFDDMDYLYTMLRSRVRKEVA